VEFLKHVSWKLKNLKGPKGMKKISFIDILEEQDTEVLFRKYGLEHLEDVQDLDLSALLEYF